MVPVPAPQSAIIKVILSVANVIHYASKSQSITWQMNEKPHGFYVTKEKAAGNQLESAIFLWLHECDPISVHTLAVAANDILNALGSKIGKPAPFNKWLRTVSKKTQERRLAPQNFFKHGFRDVNGKLLYLPLSGESILFSAVWSYQAIFKKLTPFMQLYGAFFVLQHRGGGRKDIAQGFFKGLPIDDLADLDRMKFFEIGLQELGATVDTLPVGTPHSVHA
jgi:hypothetical protein